MSTAPGNPFVFPGMGLGQAPTGGAATNPVLQSMEMMQQAWSSMSGANPFGSALPAAPLLNADELDRRVQELQAVASWLRLNLNMVQGSIQALEVQRATLATLRSFATMANAPATADQAGGQSGPSPLEVALGIKPGPRPKAEPQTPPAEGQRQPQASPDAPAPAAAADTPTTSSDTSQTSPQQAWWNMLQSQFNHLAQAAAASLPADQRGAAASGAAAASEPESPSAPAAKPRKAAARKAAPRKR